MATTITFRRGTSAPTSGSGITLGEPAFDTSLKRLYIGQGAGVTAVWVGAQISGLSADIAAGLTYQIPTMAAIKDYVASTTSGVASLNSLTGTLTLVGGTNVGVTASGTSITITNTGVQSFNGSTGAVQGVSSFNGLTGAVGGVTTSVANTFTALQTFNSGITTAFIYSSIGSTFNSTLQVNGGATFAGRVDVGGTFKTVGDAQIGDQSTDTLTVFAGTTFQNRTNFAGNNSFANGITSAGNIQFTGTTAKGLYSNQGTVTIIGATASAIASPYNALSLGVQTTDPLTVYSATGVVDIATNNPLTPMQPALRFNTDDQDVIGPGSIKIQPLTYATAARTQYLQDASGTLALTSQLMGAINGSTAATTAVTSFNGLTGAVGGVCAAQANTFTAVQTFNSGVTFASTTDHTGAARFASTVTATGAVTANGGLTASTLDVSGTARTTGDMTVGATLTVSGNFIVNGTTTTINATTLTIDDKNIVLADGNTLDTGADGGGITLKGASDKTFNWVDSTDSWTSSEHMDLAAAKVYKIGTTTVLSSNSLGSGVTGSSLTAVGTLTTGVWQATTIGVTYGGTGLTSYTIGDIIYASNTGTLAKLPSTTSGYLLASTGAGAAPEYKQLLIRDADTNSIASSASASGTLTLTVQNATTSLKGVAKFDATNFTVTSGNVTVTGIDGGSY